MGIIIRYYLMEFREWNLMEFREKDKVKAEFKVKLYVNELYY